MKKSLIAVFGLIALATTSNATTVYSLNNIPGDFANSGSNPGHTFLGASGWAYRDLAGSATIGVNTNHANSGNGSGYFESLDSSGQGTLAHYMPGNTNFGGLVGNHGTLSSLTALSFEHFRESSSTSGGNAVIKLELQNVSGGGYGQLVFDFAESGLTPTGDAWDFIDIMSNSSTYKFRGTSGLGALAGGTFNYNTLDWWIGQAGSWDIVTVNFGIGSGETGIFKGAVDNLHMVSGTGTLDANFEAVPEPCTMIALGLGAVAALRKRTKKSS